MKKTIFLAVILIFSANFLYAQNEEKTPPVSLNPPQFISGEVLNVNTDDPTTTIVTIKDILGQETVLEVNPNLSITKIISPSELSAGDKIRITYEEKDNKKIVRNIFLGRPQPLRVIPAKPADDTAGEKKEK